MNSHVARALLDDAFYQVLDNKVFRLLFVLAICLIAPAFLLAFKPDGISVLFGMMHIDYKELFAAFGGGRVPSMMKHPNVMFVQGIQTLIVQGLAGYIGLFFCIAATAFFVPRMLEKGAADTVFSKPVSRLALLLARYASGVMFVAFLSFVLVLGMHLGFSVMSGYSEPSFLWSALTLTYQFSLLHAFSTAVGVWTRSTVAAMLATLIFFAFNGVIHWVWINGEHEREQTRVERESAEGEPAPEIAESNSLLNIIGEAFRGLHYVLPKTSDADVLTFKFRQAVAGVDYVLKDEKGRLLVGKDPVDFTREDHSVDVDMQEHPAVWIAKDAQGAVVGRIELSRRNRVIEKPAAEKPDRSDSKPESGDKKPAKPQRRRQSSNQAANELMKQLSSQKDLVEKPTRSSEPSRRTTFEYIRWSERGDSGPVAREKAFFAVEDWMYQLDATMNLDWLDDDKRVEHVTGFAETIRADPVDPTVLSPAEWYSKAFGWTSPWKYNAFFSIASSLLFAALVLGLASWKLSRIDF